MQDCVWAHSFELDDRGLETLHKVPDGLRSSHVDVEKASNALLPSDRAHILRDELLS